MRSSHLGANGIVNKQMGDGLMAIFNFPIKIEQHAEMAITAALDIQRHCKAALAALAARFGVTSDKVGIGVGIHSGQVEIGEFSTVRSDFTAIGGTVNMAARLKSQAAAGGILCSSESAALAPSLITKPTRSLTQGHRASRAGSCSHGWGLRGACSTGKRTVASRWAMFLALPLYALVMSARGHNRPSGDVG